MNRFLHSLLLGFVLLAGALRAAETVPPAPARFFNDYTETVTPSVAAVLNEELAQYERDSSNQLLVVVFAHMQSDSSIEDYTVRVAQTWHTGQQGRNNGAILFVFKNDRKLYIQVGYGLEATLTDANAHAIVETILKPAFRSGDFDRGFTDAVHAMIAATKGEFNGSGRTQAEAKADNGNETRLYFIGAFFFFIVLIAIFGSKNQTRMVRGRRLKNGRWVTYTHTVSDSSWSSSSSSSSSSSDSGSSYSGGGGSFGGGGSGGSW